MNAAARRVVLVLACALAPAAAVIAQQPKAFGAGDPALGKPMVDKDCVACHERKFGTDARAYTRIDRKVHNPEQLLAQVQLCNVELKAGYFPDDEEHVAAYLNARYYGFKP